MQMGNYLKKQIIFKHLTANTPKIKPTSTPILANSQTQQQSSSKSAMSYLDQVVIPANRCPAYHFGSKKKFGLEQSIVYKLPQSVSVLTYNVWFEQHNKEARFACILKILQLSNADFICLQEVTGQFMGLLHGLSTNSWIKDYYTCVIPMGWYDTIILTKYKCKFYKIGFENSFMGRSMLFAELITADGNNLIVGSMHYESLQGNEKLRQEQILAVQNVTKKCERVIIAGDYNLSDGYDENKVQISSHLYILSCKKKYIIICAIHKQISALGITIIKKLFIVFTFVIYMLSKVFDKAYTDIWVLIKGLNQNRYTMPKTTQFSPWRPDHILFKAPKKVNLKQAQIQKVGEFTIPPFENDSLEKIATDNIVRTPSDHFGLISWLPLI